MKDFSKKARVGYQEAVTSCGDGRISIFGTTKEY